MKNKIKTPQQDNLDGTGYNKLSWEESNKQIKNIKKLESTFSDNININSSNKKQVNCSICDRKFYINNINRIPDHSNKKYWWSKKDNICEGSWSMQLNGEIVIEELNEVSSFLGLIIIGDILLIDFRMPIINNTQYNDIVECKVNKITITRYLNNKGLYSNRFKEELHFENVLLPISTFLTRYMCKL
jgi:hypothetical protein